MKYTTPLIVATILLSLLISNSCKKEECDKVSLGVYEFVLPFKLSPAQETYHIGDTITIKSIITNPIYERKTDKNYILNDIKFYLSTLIYYMDTSIIDYSNIHFFDLIVDSNFSYNTYNFSNGGSWINGQYNYSNNTYSLVFKLIPKKTGLFFISQGSDIYLQNSDQYFEGKCDNTGIDAKIYTNNRSDNNIHLVNECTNDYYQGYIEKKETHYLDFGGYCFKVID